MDLDDVRLGFLAAGLPEDVVDEALEAYVEANREGQAWLLRYCDDRGIDYQERSAYSYANTAAGTTALRTEFELAEQAGLAVSWVDQSSELPFPIHGGVALPGQAQFDPMDVVRALADDFRAEGGRLHTGVRATGVQVDQRCVLETELGELGAERIVLATGMPILDRGLHFAKLEPERSYLVSYAGVVDPPRGMYLSVDQPSRSLRTATGPDGSEQLLVGGNGHVVGRATSEQQKVDDLRRWAAEHFPGATETHWWSAQDYRPVDALPVVGALPRGGGRVFVATGYSKWGMTNGVAAAQAICAHILGDRVPWGEAFGTWSPHEVRGGV